MPDDPKPLTEPFVTYEAAARHYLAPAEEYDRGECLLCGGAMETRDGDEPTPICDHCAHATIPMLLQALDAARAQLAEAEAHVDKLTDILDNVTACSESCDISAVLAWVDPADKMRVRELRDHRIAEAEARGAERMRTAAALVCASDADQWDKEPNRTSTIIARCETGRALAGRIRALPTRTDAKG